MHRLVQLARMAILLTLVTAVPAQAKMSAPRLESPAHEARVSDAPLFTWKAVKNAEHYEVQVAADRLFGSVVGSRSIRTRNLAASLNSLTLPEGTYYWRVRAVDKKGDAGPWTRRSFDKEWRNPPTLIEPLDGLSVVWPQLPLVLRWNPVPHALKYRVTVATDPSLAQPVIGTVRTPVETQGTSYAPQTTLTPGQTYYWAVTALDSGGHPGQQSAVGRFTWNWPTGTEVSVEDLNAAPEVFDPLLRWKPVAGASHYDVEINTTSDFAVDSKVFSETVIGSSLAPTKPLENNAYFWRVRSVDSTGRAGLWHVGQFEKAFDSATPSVKNIRIAEATLPNDGNTLAPNPVVSAPVMTWDSVPGAAEYEVHVVRRVSGNCNWAEPETPTGTAVKERTPIPVFDFATESITSARPGAMSWPTSKRKVYPFAADQYCVRILARDGAGVRLRTDRNDSPWTYLNGFNQPAFTYAPPAAVPSSCAYIPLAREKYQAPVDTGETNYTPALDWEPEPGAAAYWVIVARDANLTEAIDVVLTPKTYYVPRETYEDEETSYYWAIWPTDNAGGQCPSQPNPEGWTYPRFVKRSTAPGLTSPADGAQIGEQPLFTWAAAPLAADYRIQVARDASFREILDDVTTPSTAYASSKTYPVDLDLYWRVRARDVDNIELNWSSTRRFRRVLPTPVLSADNPGGGETIPILAWESVPGAISYDLHVDQADGRKRDFTVPTTRATPTVFYGTGVWRWQVRANFPALGGTVSGPYSAPMDYIRRILPPTGIRTHYGGGRVALTWDPSPAAAKYRVEVSSTDSFSRMAESETSLHTNWAPKMTSTAFKDGGTLYWRIAAVDEGNNYGAYNTGQFKLPIVLKLKPRRVKGQRKFVVTVTTPRGSAVRLARVKVSGAGLRGSKRTNRKGQVTFRLRKRGTVKLTASKKGFKAGSTTFRVAGL